MGSHRRTTQGILRTRYPITVGWTEAMWIHSLPKASMHDQCCRESNPEPLDIESSALTIQPRTPHVLWRCLNRVPTIYNTQP